MLIKIIGFLAVGFLGIILSLAILNPAGFTNITGSFSIRAADDRITHGPIVGAVSDREATVWFRGQLSSSKKYTVKVAPSLKELKDGGVTKLGKNARVSNVNISGPDSTFKSVLTDLLPSTTYYVNIFSGDTAQLTTPTRFKTFASPGTDAEFKMIILTDFGTSSPIQNPSSPNAKTFASVDQEVPKADLIFLGGDLWHTNLASKSISKSDFRQKNRDMFKSIYSLGSSAGPYDDFVKYILPNYSLMHVYDDHDLGHNNANKDFAWKEATLAVLNEYFPTYKTSPNGAWQKGTYGNVDFFILDTRSQRDNNNDPDNSDKSMLDGNNLGQDGQLAWLFDSLKSSKAKWKILFSGSPFNPTGIKMDSWSGFKSERKKILDFITTNSIKGVVIISGDEHMGAIDNGSNSGVPEMLVPGPNLAYCSTTNDPGTWSQGTYGDIARGGDQDPPCHGFGVLKVQANPDRIVMRVKNGEGKSKLVLQYFLNPEEAVKYPSLTDIE